MSLIKNVFNHRIKRYGEIHGLRNGDLTQYLTSVEVEEVVKTCGCILEFVEGFI